MTPQPPTFPHRLFNVLFTICGVWIAILIWKWFDMLPVLGAGIVLVLMAAPLAVVGTIYYLSGI